MDQTTDSPINVRIPFSLKLDFSNNTVILSFNPQLMLHGYENALDADLYQSNLERIKRRIDWCVRKSAGEEPNLDDYEA